MMAKAFLMGNVGTEPEIKEIREGRSFARFRVATEERWMGKDGEWTGRTHWFTVSAFGKTAERCATLKKGTLVWVAGRLQTSKSDDGRVWTEISAEEIRTIRKPREEAGDAQSGSDGHPMPFDRDDMPGYESSGGDSVPGPSGEDIPF